MALRGAPGKETRGENRPENAAPFDRRHEHAEAVERMRDVRSAEAECHDGDRRVFDAPQHPEEVANVRLPREAGNGEGRHRRDQRGRHRFAPGAILAPDNPPTGSRNPRDFLHACSKPQVVPEDPGQPRGKHPHALAEGHHLPRRPRAAQPYRAPDERTMGALQVPKLGKSVARGKFLRIARKNSRDKRLDGVSEHLGPETPPHKVGQRLVVRGSPGDKGLAQHAQFSAQGKQRRGHRSDRPRRQRQCAVAAHEETLLRHGPDDVRPEPRLAEEPDHVRLVGHQRARPLLHEKALRLLGAHRSARARGRFKHGDRPAAPLQGRRHRQPGNAGPYDHDIAAHFLLHIRSFSNAAPPPARCRHRNTLQCCG